MDTLTAEERSRRMSLIRGKDSKPEIIVRRLVHSLGYRYRLHVKHLPGKPDLVFAGRKKVVFVHGCFWHRHNEKTCALTRWPKSRLDFWKPKLEKNQERDQSNQKQLLLLGWRYLVVWECEVRDLEKLRKRVTKFLEKP